MSHIAYVCCGNKIISWTKLMEHYTFWAYNVSVPCEITLSIVYVYILNLLLCIRNFLYFHVVYIGILFMYWYTIIWQNSWDSVCRGKSINFNMKERQFQWNFFRFFFRCMVLIIDEFNLISSNWFDEKKLVFGFGSETFESIIDCSH